MLVIFIHIFVKTCLYGRVLMLGSWNTTHMSLATNYPKLWVAILYIHIYMSFCVLMLV